MKKIHSTTFSMGFYFAMSLRDCYCDECSQCTFSLSEKTVCNYRKLLSPSMQSQGIDPLNFGKGKYGIELLQFDNEMWHYTDLILLAEAVRIQETIFLN